MWRKVLFAHRIQTNWYWNHNIIILIDDAVNDYEDDNANNDVDDENCNELLELFLYRIPLV